MQAQQHGWHVQVRETVRDVAMLHNESFFAAAQKKHAYIYDKHGLEVHCLKVCLRQGSTSLSAQGAGLRCGARPPVA